MYLELEDMANAKLADYNRMLASMHLEREAVAVAKESREKPQRARHLHLPWVYGRHRHSAI